MVQKLGCNKRKRGVCGEECDDCLPRSFAAYHDTAKVATWSVTNTVQPCQVSMSSHIKFKFDCTDCNHEVEQRPYNIIKGQNCGYCGNQQLCADDDCSTCFNKSLASFNPDKLFWWSSSNEYLSGLTPRQIFKQANKLRVLFDCCKCGHTFEITPASLSAEQWCGFCGGGNKLCDADSCIFCTERSFASYNDAVKVSCWDTEANNGWTPRDVFKSSGESYWFKCCSCQHCFKMTPNNITSGGHWCPYCCNSSKAICGAAYCTSCKKPCVICLQADLKVVGQRQTPDGLMCMACYIRSPHCKPSQRAKISLEMQTIHAMHEQCDRIESGYLFRELTAWDCPVLPSLNFKPDLLWVFDVHGNCFETAGTCKINLNEVAHIMILEILEHGKQQHSDARTISDQEREQQIRASLPGIPIYMLYMTVANDTYHSSAHPEDVFFTKINNDIEYSLIKERKQAWKARMKQLLETLVDARAAVSNQTQWIGN